MTYNTIKFDKAMVDLENVLEELKKTAKAIVALKPLAKNWERKHLKQN